MNAKLSWFFALGILVVSASGAKAQAYRFTDLGTGTAAAINNTGQVAGTDDFAAVRWDGTSKTVLGPGPVSWGVSSAAYDINEAGQVVGRIREGRVDADFPTLWIDGSGMTLPWSNLSVRASALAINNSGQVLGFDESRGAFVWDGNRTEAKLLSALPGGNGSQGLAINNAGVVAGWSDTTGGADHATVWSGSTVSDLGVLHGGRESQALAINDAELVAGWSDTRSIGGPSHATLWEGSRMIDLGFLPGGNASKALGINDAGMAVGWSSSFPEGQRAVLWNGATAIDLNSFLDADKASAGWHLTSANDINERGWIVGDAHNNLTGEDHAFLLVPAANLSTGFWLVNFSNDSGYPEWRDWNGSELHFLTEFPGGDNRLLSGYIEWTSNNGDFGRENFEGTLDANNHLALNGMAIVQPASKDVDIGWYEADLGSGTLLNGSWARRDDNGSLTLGNWAAVQVVPEPQTYIMLLAGLGLVGFMMRGQKADNRVAIS